MRRARSKEPQVMEPALQALRAGAMSFAAFERATREDWNRIAHMLYGRWPLPAGVEVADVRQELLLALVRPYGAKAARDGKPEVKGKTLFESWDPARCASLARYVTWNAIVWVCRWLHDQRGVYKSKENGGSRGKEKSAHARPLSSYQREDGTSAVPEAAAPETGDARAFGEMVDAVIAKLRSPRDRAVIELYLDTGGSVQEAARLLASDPALGMTGEITTERAGVAVVTGVIRRTQWAAARVTAMQAEA